MITQATALKEHIALFQKAIQVVKAKRVDYSGKTDPFGNFRKSVFWGVEPWRGSAIRLMDKLSRFAQLAECDGKGKVTDETMEDTVVDALNYIVITYQLWKESQGGK